MAIYIVTKIAPFDHNEFVSCFKTLEEAKKFIKSQSVPINYSIFSQVL
jgi:hypothetical protein